MQFLVYFSQLYNNFLNVKILKITYYFAIYKKCVYWLLNRSVNLPKNVKFTNGVREWTQKHNTVTLWWPKKAIEVYVDSEDSTTVDKFDGIIFLFQWFLNK